MGEFALQQKAIHKVCLKAFLYILLAILKFQTLISQSQTLQERRSQIQLYKEDGKGQVKNKKTENKSAIEKLKEMQSKLAENINCEEEEKDLF